MSCVATVAVPEHNDPSHRGQRKSEERRGFYRVPRKRDDQSCQYLSFKSHSVAALFFVKYLDLNRWSLSNESKPFFEETISDTTFLFFHHHSAPNDGIALAPTQPSHHSHRCTNATLFHRISVSPRRLYHGTNSNFS